ncbi:MAG: anti-sigma factor [Actinobacteria bacterium]|nr:MAG: anti-sigma factor [Actinomycetota bacterium]
MSARDHGPIEELLAARALGGLEPEDDAALRAAMAAHGDCEECRRLETGFEETAGLLGFALDPERVRGAGRARGRQPRRRAALVVVAAALVVVIAGVATLRPRTQPIAGASAAQQVRRFQGGAGTLAMLYEPGQPGALVWGEDLPSPGAGKTYEIWMITGSAPVSAGCASPTDGELSAFTDADVSRSDLMAVTVEPRSCPPAPTTQPVYTATLA